MVTVGVSFSALCLFSRGGAVKKVARVERCDSVHIIAFTDDKNILLLREYRPFYGEYIWMLPSGKADKEKDMSVAAQRELQEETGFRASELTLYCTTNHSESLISSNHIFIARKLTPAPLPQDDDELIVVHRLSLDDALEKILSSKIVHTASAYALLRYLREGERDASRGRMM
ncbi:NUDIX hydrolase [Candidatus Peribacteria bacterium]|nr:NUDIX hydrolase [Candidatus Peribacteria bacterium]